MTPRQLAASAYFRERDDCIKQGQLFNVMSLAHGGKKKDVEEFFESLGLGKTKHAAKDQVQQRHRRIRKSDQRQRTEHGGSGERRDP